MYVHAMMGMIEMTSSPALNATVNVGSAVLTQVLAKVIARDPPSWIIACTYIDHEHEQPATGRLLKRNWGADQCMYMQ
jgi:hypothetical protein